MTNKVIQFPCMLLAITFLLALASPVSAQSSWYDLPSPQDQARIAAEQKEFRKNLPPDWGCHPLIDCRNVEKIRKQKRRPATSSDR